MASIASIPSFQPTMAPLWFTAIQTVASIALLWTRTDQKNIITRVTHLHLPDRTLINAPFGSVYNSPSQYQPLEITTGETLADQTVSIGVDKTNQRAYTQSFRADANATSITLNPSTAILKTSKYIIDNSKGCTQPDNFDVTDTLSSSSVIAPSIHATRYNIPQLTSPTFISAIDIATTNTTASDFSGDGSAQHILVQKHQSTGSLDIADCSITNVVSTTIQGVDNGLITHSNTTTVSSVNAMISMELVSLNAQTANVETTTHTTVAMLNTSNIRYATNVVVNGRFDATDIISTSTAASTMNSTSTATSERMDVTKILTTVAIDVSSGAFDLASLNVNGVGISVNGVNAVNDPVLFQVYIETAPNGTNAGSESSGQWITRTFSSLSIQGSLDGVYTSMQHGNLSLQNGTYSLRVRAPGFNGFGFQARLLDAVTGIPEVYGTSSTSSGSQTESTVDLVVTVTSGSTRTFSVQTAYAISSANGLGVSSGITGTTEVYTALVVKRLDQVRLIDKANQWTYENIYIHNPVSIPTMTLNTGFVYPNSQAPFNIYETYSMSITATGTGTSNQGSTPLTFYKAGHTVTLSLGLTSSYGITAATALTAVQMTPSFPPDFAPIGTIYLPITMLHELMVLLKVEGSPTYTFTLVWPTGSISTTSSDYIQPCTVQWNTVIQ